MKFKVLVLLLTLSCTACVVVPESDLSEQDKMAQYQCELSTDKKVLKLVNLNDGDTSFYAWNDEILAFVTLPASAIISSTYVLVNNIYHIGEKQIKCRDITTK